MKKLLILSLIIFILSPLEAYDSKPKQIYSNILYRTAGLVEIGRYSEEDFSKLLNKICKLTKPINSENNIDAIKDHLDIQSCVLMEKIDNSRLIIAINTREAKEDLQPASFFIWNFERREIIEYETSISYFRSVVRCGNYIYVCGYFEYFMDSRIVIMKLDITSGLMVTYMQLLRIPFLQDVNLESLYIEKCISVNGRLIAINRDFIMLSDDLGDSWRVVYLHEPVDLLDITVDEKNRIWILGSSYCIYMFEDITGEPVHIYRRGSHDIDISDFECEKIVVKEDVIFAYAQKSDKIPVYKADLSPDLLNWKKYEDNKTEKILDPIAK